MHLINIYCDDYLMPQWSFRNKSSKRAMERAFDLVLMHGSRYRAEVIHEASLRCIAYYNGTSSDSAMRGKPCQLI